MSRALSKILLPHLIAPALLAHLAMSGSAIAQPTQPTQTAPSEGPAPTIPIKIELKKPDPNAPLDWALWEPHILTEQVQLTFDKEFVRAGEAYFDHSSPPKFIAFQAQYVPDPNRLTNSPHFHIYLAKLRYDASGRSIVGIDPPTLVSRDESANTCVWFAPPSLGSEMSGVLLYASTYTKPQEDARTPGYSKDRNRYTWTFPSNMRIFTQNIEQLFKGLNPDVPSPRRYKQFLPQKLFDVPTDAQGGAGPGYMAECSWSEDGRFVLYTYVPASTGDPNIWVWDSQANTHTILTAAKGYDGGPFFSPDGKWITYRSDRRGDNNLQLFIAELQINDAGNITGIKREIQLTNDNDVVNWAPFWHPSGEYLVYASSQMGHRNYEVFAIRVADIICSLQTATIDAPLPRVRVTQATGFDGLPAFSADGSHLIFTSQRQGPPPGKEKASSQVWVAKWSEPDWQHAASPAPTQFSDEKPAEPSAPAPSAPSQTPAAAPAQP